jgi:hypothetical protein
MSSPFTLRSDHDVLETFRKTDQDSVIFLGNLHYPLSIQSYHTWTDPSGVYTYLVYKRQDWETPLGLVFQRNKPGASVSPAGMCEWCNSFGASNETGLMTTNINAKVSGGTWLCLDLSCAQKIQEMSGCTARAKEKRLEKLFQKIGAFYQRVRFD